MGDGGAFRCSWVWVHRVASGTFGGPGVESAGMVEAPRAGWGAVFSVRPVGCLWAAGR